MCNYVTMLHSRKLTEQCKPAIMEKSKNNYISKKQKLYGESSKNLKEKYHFIQWFHFWEMKMESQIAISTPIGTTASLTISKVWKQPKLFINRWMDKENVCTHTHTHTHIHTHTGVLFSLEKEGNPAICNNMDGPEGYYAKWNNPDKEKHHMISLIMWKLKKPNP